MADATALQEFLVISRGKWDENLAPEVIQSAIDRFYVWHDQLVAQGKMKPGQRLTPEIKLVTKRAILDGPFAETKEVVGGYWFVYAPSLEEAAQILTGNPCVGCGLMMEIRPTVACKATAFETTCETPVKSDKR